jgi:CheY-like chemotaxis protein
MSEAKKILIAEDDDVERELMRRTLERQGYAVTAACDGLEAYDLAVRHRPDLIITDVFMPAADGAHLLRRVRDNAELASTPVLVTTGFGTGAPTLTLAQGADAYEPKPVDPASLLESVRRLLSGGGGRGDNGPDENPETQSRGD